MFFLKVTQSQELKGQSQAHTAEAVVSSEVKDIQAEVHETLRALQQQQQDPVNALDDDKVGDVLPK